MKKFLMISVIGFIATLFFASSVSAVTISPLIINEELNPGQSDSQAVELYNEGDKDIYLTGKIEAFKPKGESGEIEILPPEVAYQALSWIKMPVNSLSLKPGERVKAPIFIDIPKTAQVGGYYVAAMWTANLTPKPITDKVQVASRVGTLVLLKVFGDSKESLLIDNFSLGEKNIFYDSLPVKFNTRLKNDGTVHLKPNGYVNVKNMFGRLTETIRFNPEAHNVLPQSYRQFDIVWSGEYVNVGVWQTLKNRWHNFAFGRYTARLSVEYGDSRQRIDSSEIVFWVIPWQIISIIFGIVILLVVVKIFLSKKTKRYKGGEIGRI